MISVLMLFPLLILPCCFSYKMLSLFDPSGKRIAAVALRNCFYMVPLGFIAYDCESSLPCEFIYSDCLLCLICFFFPFLWTQGVWHLAGFVSNQRFSQWQLLLQRFHSTDTEPWRKQGRCFTPVFSSYLFSCLVCLYTASMMRTNNHS